MLSALVTNGMKESQEKVATLSEVREEEFAHFFQFAYTGDYNTGECDGSDYLAKQEAESSEDMQPAVSAFRSKPRKIPKIQGYGHEYSPSFTESYGGGMLKENIDLKSNTWGPVWSSWGSLSTRTDLTTFFHNKTYHILHTLKTSLDKPGSVNQHTKCNLMAHARLFEFAEIYLVDSLKPLILQKLHRALCGSQLTENELEAVVELIRFVHSEDRAADMEEIRVMVTIYVASKYQKFQSSAEFEKGVEAGGSFVIYLLKLLRGRMH
jgi:hypothetical protein